jgi:gluconolactonase
MHATPRLALLTLFAAAASAADAVRAEDAAAFAEVVDAHAELRQLATGFGFTEGPVWAGDDGRGGGTVFFSDQPAKEIFRWREGGTPVLISVVPKARGTTNGNAFARLIPGRPPVLVTCAHDLHALLVSPDPEAFTTLVDEYEGKPLNSPNDLVVAKDQAIWFTDPTWGLGKRTREQAKNRVYRFMPATKRLTAMIDTMEQPNGICFSPDGATLYVAESGAAHRVLAWDVEPGPKLVHEREVAVIAPGVPDGLKCDAAGRLYVAAGDGVQVFDDGRLIGRIQVPETPSNLCFGGEDGKTLFITAKTSLYAIAMQAVGSR